MESLDILILGVEASIAFAGFSGVVASFQFGGENEIRPKDFAGLQTILQFSLLAALICSMPLLLYTFGLKETTVWAICSALTVIILVWAIFSSLVQLHSGVRSRSFRIYGTIAQCPSLGMVLINVMNASDIFFHREAGPVVASILWILCVSGYFFTRLLFLPIVRSLRIQAAAKLADATSG